MSSKKPSLSAALHEATGRTTANRAEPSMPGIPKTKIVSASRRGQKVLSGHFDPAVSRQFKHLALERDSTVQALLAEALNDLFIKYQRNPIA
jgi:hypothetical protein